MNKGRRELVAVDAAAHAAGLKIGMGVAHATALVPGLSVVDAAPEADAALLAQLAAWAIRYTPLVGIDPPDGLWLDVSGCAHLFGGEETLLARLRARFGAMGLKAFAAVADTAGAAHAVARFCGGGVVPPGETEAWLQGLPIAALRLPPDLVSSLEGLGFEHVRHLIETPAAPLTRRFGSLPRVRLDQALGSIGEPLMPIDPPPMPACRRGFVEPITAPESLAQVTRDLTADLCATLDRAGKGARRLDLLFERIDGACLAVCIGTVRPSRDPVHLARLLVERLETIEPGLGIETMALTAPQVEPLVEKQISTLCRKPREADLTGLVDRLANRIGGRRLWRSFPIESHTPERSIARVAPLAKPCNAGWPPDLPRPVRLVDPPERIEVIAQVPDYPPSFFRWRGRRYRIRQSDGLERIFGDWWDCKPLYALRDYYRVEVEDGGRYWLFRARDEAQVATAPADWFIHGAFA